LLTHYIQEYPDVVIVHMSGMMTREFLNDIEDIWNEELEKRPGVLAFDLKGVMDIDSITMNHIFKLAKRATTLDVKLIICDTSEQLKKIFEIININRVITVMTNQKFHEEYIKRSYSGGTP
jgi:anti-anti-sigma factor